MSNEPMQWQIGPPTLTKLEYFTLIIASNLEGRVIDFWVDNAIERAQALIAELDKVQAQEAKP